MLHIHQKALGATAAIALSLGAYGIAFADPVGVSDSSVAVAGSDSQTLRDQTQPRHRPLAFHRARPHNVSKQRPAADEAHNAPLPILVAYNLGSLVQSALNCKGENAWSLLCPGAGVIGVSY
jgi:hypothetical protein